MNGVPILPDCVVMCHYPDEKVYGRIDMIDFIYPNDMFSMNIINKKNLRCDRWIEVIDSDDPVVSEIVHLLKKYGKNKSGASDDRESKEQK